MGLERSLIPPRIARLEDLSHNLWWSWNCGARELFKTLDPGQWKLTHHNPVRLLGELPAQVLEAAARDEGFLRTYDRVIAAMEAAAGDEGKWFGKAFPSLKDRTVAYFSAEFGLHSSLPIYSGGLGILAGDQCKESSDLGVPLVGVGFVYPQGYFHQQLRSDGWQEDVYQKLDRDMAPIRRAVEDRRFLVQLRLNEETVHFGVWQVRLGGVSLYLMDTDVEENETRNRDLSARLYGGDREHRIRQEIVLGIGGVRALRALGVDPEAWHANEGHTAFMFLERIRELVRDGHSFDQASEAVRESAVFTTHTPVPAGHDAFSFDMVEKYFANYYDKLGLTRQQFMELGAHDGKFNMTVLALRTTGHRNGVSRLHGQVSRRMWRTLWPDIAEDRVPIGSITNGVHAPTWIAPELSLLLDRYLGEDWVERHDDADLWQGVFDIPDEEFWDVHLRLKRKLLAFVRERARGRWSSGEVDPKQVIGMGSLLDPDALTISFARRFTGYKRASLIFEDLERMRSLITDRWRPVQLVFGGKAHPADEHGKQLIQNIYSLATDHGLAGHVAFVENYEMHAARFLVQGADVWLNTPRPPLEACGTSGQKAGMNGVLNLSVPDGWWFEGFEEGNGWSIGSAAENLETRADDPSDATALYEILENEVIPLFYERDRGLPRRWIRMAKRSIATIVPRFSARRMMKEYVRESYAPALEAGTRRPKGSSSG